MKIHAYGEDALTLWAIKEKLKDILSDLKDETDPQDCIVFFRPSFGRSGGEKSAQFGEFDFIVLSNTTIYLGESKWDGSSEVKGDTVYLRKEQIFRHKLFTDYVNKWCSQNGNVNWSTFINAVGSVICIEGENKPIAPAGSFLAENLTTVLEIINKHFGGAAPIEIKNILLYLHNGLPVNKLPQFVKRRPTTAPSNQPAFKIVPIDYSVARFGMSRFINI